MSNRYKNGNSFRFRFSGGIDFIRGVKGSSLSPKIFSTVFWHHPQFFSHPSRQPNKCSNSEKNQYTKKWTSSKNFFRLTQQNKTFQKTEKFTKSSIKNVPGLMTWKESQDTHFAYISFRRGKILINLSFYGQSLPIWYENCCKFRRLPDLVDTERIQNMKRWSKFHEFQPQYLD